MNCDKIKKISIEALFFDIGIILTYHKAFYCGDVCYIPYCNNVFIAVINKWLSGIVLKLIIILIIMVALKRAKLYNVFK